MKAETNLKRMLQQLSPVQHDGAYVFVSVPDIPELLRKHLVMHFREMEGHTLILPRTVADEHQLSYDFIAAWITLKVHSALAAVGLTAAFSTHLAKAGISCNVVAGYYHDHIFVAEADAQRAMELLENLAASAN
ncbi:MAG: ACT domain-containing protein [Bacteroidota bacterium]